MKNQNPHNKLAFNKVAVAELNQTQLLEVNGGTSTNVGTTSLLLVTILQNI